MTKLDNNREIVMKYLTKDEAMQAGGNLWAKNNIERVYLDISAINALRTQNGYAAMTKVSKIMSKAKTYLNVSNGETYTDSGRIRCEITGIGFYCNG